MRRICVLSALALALLLIGCERSVPDAVPTASSRQAIFQPDEVDIPSDTVEAELLTAVNAADRVVSVVLSGFTDEQTMERLADELRQRSATPLFLLAGEAAADHPQSVRSIAEAGFSVGSAGLTAHTASDGSNARRYRQLRRSRELLSSVTGRDVRQFSLGGVEYSDTLLRLATLSGLEQAIQPSAYLNYRSFSSAEQATAFVRAMPRGTLLCFKLGQELTEAEYGHPTGVLDEKPAIDPEAGLFQADAPLDEQRNLQSVNGALWLIDALQAEGYTLLPPEALSAYAAAPANELTDEQLARTDAARYPALQTPQSLNVLSATAERTRTLLIGDETLGAVAAYVDQIREHTPSFLSNAVFLTSRGLSCERALWQVSDASYHPVLNGEKLSLEQAIVRTQADQVLVLLGLHDLTLRDAEAYAERMETLLRSLRNAAPDCRIVVVSILPTAASQTEAPDNAAIFAADLLLCRLCLQNGYDYADAAFALRGDAGALDERYSSEQSILNDNGCKALLDCLQPWLPPDGEGS